MKNLIFIGLIAFLSCQENQEVVEEKITTNLVEENSEGFPNHQATNQIDAKGKQGIWIVYGKDMDDMRYPSEGKIEEGHYRDDKKTGQWIYYMTDGMTVQQKSNYTEGELDGITISYDYEKGILTEINYEMGKILTTATRSIDV